MFRAIILRASRANFAVNFPNAANSIKGSSRMMASSPSGFGGKDYTDKMRERHDFGTSGDDNVLHQRYSNPNLDPSAPLSDALHTAKEKVSDVTQKIKQKAEDVASKVQHSRMGQALGLEKDEDSQPMSMDPDPKKPVRKVTNDEQAYAYNSVKNPFANKEQKRTMATTSRSSDSADKQSRVDDTIPWTHSDRESHDRPTTTRNSMPSSRASDEKFRGPLPESQRHTDVVGSTKKHPIDKEFADEHGGMSAYTPIMPKKDDMDIKDTETKSNADDRTDSGTRSNPSFQNQSNPSEQQQTRRSTDKTGGGSSRTFATTTSGTSSRKSSQAKDQMAQPHRYETERPTIPQSPQKSTGDPHVAAPHMREGQKELHDLKEPKSGASTFKADKYGPFGSEVRRAYSTLVEAPPVHIYPVLNRVDDFTNFEKHGGVRSWVFQSILDQYPGVDPSLILKKRHTEHPLTVHLASLYQSKRSYGSLVGRRGITTKSKNYYGNGGDGGNVKQYTDSRGRINQSESETNHPDRHQDRSKMSSNQDNRNRDSNPSGSQMHTGGQHTRSTTSTRSTDREGLPHDDMNPDRELQEDLDGMFDGAERAGRDYDAEGWEHDKTTSTRSKGQGGTSSKSSMDRGSPDSRPDSQRGRGGGGGSNPNVDPGHIFKRFYSSRLRDRITLESDPNAKNFPFKGHVDDPPFTVVPRSGDAAPPTPPNVYYTRKVEERDRVEKVIPSRYTTRRGFTSWISRLSKYDEEGIRGSKGMKSDLEKRLKNLEEVASECSFEGSGGSFSFEGPETSTQTPQQQQPPNKQQQENTPHKPF